MAILFLMTAPPPPIEGTDAVFADVSALNREFQGEVFNLCPLRSSIRRVPKQLYGFHKALELQRLERKCSINHIFFSYPYPFPVLRLLSKPIVYTVTASLDRDRAPPNRRTLRQLQRFHRILVSNERDAAVLRTWGLTNHAVVRQGVDATSLVPAPLQLAQELTLLVASAPWTESQFSTKGIDLLLAACERLPFLRLMLVWRGVLTDTLIQRVRRLRIENRVEIVDGKVRISDYLARAHAAVVLARTGGLVKSYPHSLIESLLSGKPVLLNDTIAMADFVTNRQCGVVLPEMDLGRLISAIETLRLRYAQFVAGAAAIEPDMFSLAAMLERHRAIYGLA